LVEEKWLKEPPNHLVTPMFGHNVGRIEFTGQMEKTNEFGSSSFMNTVKRESVVALVELGIWNGRAIHNSPVVAKCVAHLMDRNTKVPKCGVEIDHLVNTHMGCNEFRPIGGSFNSHLFLGVPVNGCLVHKMQHAASDRTTLEHVMVKKVGIKIIHQCDILAKRSRDAAHMS
jgi:hypothetical protein